MNLPIKENKVHIMQWSLPGGHGTFNDGSFKGTFSLSGAAIVINVEPDKQYEQGY